LRFRFRGSIEVNKIGGESFSVAIIVQQFLEKTNQRVAANALKQFYGQHLFGAV
jgi:hypothetical protein